jgi:metal transporter CNNM
MIVIFGEIIPQAVSCLVENKDIYQLTVQVCVRYGLAIGGACAPLVLGLMIIFAPIAFPIAKLLDYVLGREEGHTWVFSRPRRSHD